MPVALASPVRCRIGGLRAALCTRRLSPSRSTCVDGAEHGPEHSSKGERALLTMSRVPFSWRSGHPGRRLDSPPGLDDLAAPRTGRDSSWMQPRERPHRRENRGAFHRDGTLTRAKDCSFVRAWTAAPSRHLLRRHCSGARAPLLPPRSVPSSDEDSTTNRLDLSEQ